jgi:chitinase
MKLGLIFAAGVLAAVPWGEGARATEGESSGPVIIAYVFPKDQLIDPAAIAADRLTHVNYAFGNVRKGRVALGFKRDAENFRVLAGVRKAHPHLRVLVSVGGWTWSGAFSDVSLTPRSRKKFVDSAIEFVLHHDLDGVDIDWEYPGLPGYGNTHRPEDKQNFTALMADLRVALDKAGTPTGRHYLLTFAAGADTDFLEHTEMDKVQASVDFVNLMTYDFREAGGSTEAGHHANLFPSPGDPRHISADRSVNEFLAAGVPAGKLVLGVPFYGHAWGDVKPENDGLFQPGKPPRPHIETHYGNLVAKVDRDGFVRHWDAAAQAPFLWNAERRIFISYEDPESLRAKSRYILDRHLAGAMFWEYYADPTGALLGTLSTELRAK